ncbi:MAG: hypothetical protein COA53_12070 [Rhodobacteraceae bacterium]|nr:MAG: hypothetical protein COA53_12070 [Paracoccaceae bacterium]
MEMLRVMACNVGYRPVVLTKFVALGETSMMTMGINDEPAATFGIEDQCFPSILNPGDSLKVHPIAIAALKRNAMDPKDDKTHFDPYRYFAFVDSFEGLHVMDADDVMFHARIDRARKRVKGWRKLQSWVAKKIFLRSAKRRIRKRF